ncbi:MAG: alcohol dehydrogenase [Trueperaceae bacterium]|nr:alcohol dehydrogenase [Trueperaceae bacterium]
MATMRAMQVSKAGGDFELVERDIPTPGRDEVRVKVDACGICHSDVFVKEGMFPGLEYPRIPGHEVAGVVDALGEGVTSWQEGQRVGVGWHGGHCFTCEPCRKGDFINCENAKITGISYDGGYAEYMVAPQEALASIPDDLSAVDAAPLLCAGITTFNALRNSGAAPGDVVAVQGVGGLGHLGIQYAHKLGFKTVAISSSPDKKDLATELGADLFIDASAEDAAEALQKLGGAKVILATAPSSKAMTSVLGGLGIDGKLLIVGIGAEPIEVPPMLLVSARRSVSGWPSGDAHDSEDTLAFSTQTKVSPMIETFPLENAAEAYDKMMSNEVRFRSVLKIT